jgi:hypothetical protein
VSRLTGAQEVTCDESDAAAGLEHFILSCDGEVAGCDQNGIFIVVPLSDVVASCDVAGVASCDGPAPILDEQNFHKKACNDCDASHGGCDDVGELVADLRVSRRSEW